MALPRTLHALLISRPIALGQGSGKMVSHLVSADGDHTHDRARVYAPAPGLSTIAPRMPHPACSRSQGGARPPSGRARRRPPTVTSPPLGLAGSWPRPYQGERGPSACSQ